LPCQATCRIRGFVDAKNFIVAVQYKPEKLNPGISFRNDGHMDAECGGSIGGQSVSTVLKRKPCSPVPGGSCLFRNAQINGKSYAQNPWVSLWISWVDNFYAFDL
jgi:hypothetical protein